MSFCQGCCCGIPKHIGPHGNRVEEGVEKKRGYTDVVFILIFAAFLGGLGYGLNYAVERGDDDRIILGFNYAGDFCGRRNPRLPNISISGRDLTSLPFLDLTQIAIRTDKFTTGLTIRTKGTCVRICPQEKLQRSQRCLPPKASLEVDELFTLAGLNKFFNQFALDFEVCWKEVVFLCLIALGLSQVMMILFRFFAGLIIWGLLIVLVLGSFAGSGYLWYAWYIGGNPISTTAMLACSIVLNIVAFMIALIVLVMRSRVNLVIALFHEAGKSIHAMPFLLLQPIWTLIALIVLCAGWTYAAIWIESAGVATIENGIVFYKKDIFLQVVRWYNVLAALWICQVCLACQSFIIAGSVANWFFTRNKSRLGFPIARSTLYCVRYHMGSFIFGCLIIALLKFVRLLFSFIVRKLKSSRNDCCSIKMCIRCCCKCCIYIFEKLIQAMCSNAYIEMAIYGNNFFWSAGRAFRILARNAPRLFFINSVGDFVLFLGKIGVVIPIIFIGKELIKDQPGLNAWSPILIASIFAYLIAHCYISVYEMCVDSIFICFCEDREINDGQLKPYYMSRSLMEFLKNSKYALRTRALRDLAQTYVVENNAVTTTTTIVIRPI